MNNCKNSFVVLKCVSLDQDQDTPAEGAPYFITYLLKLFKLLKAISNIRTGENANMGPRRWDKRQRHGDTCGRKMQITSVSPQDNAAEVLRVL